MALTALPATIETPRLRLRPFEFSDVDDVLAYAADDEWRQYLPVPSPYTAGDAVRFVAQQVLADRERAPNWALEFEGRCVGGVSIRFWFEDGYAMMGWAVARRVWRRGLATEAARAILDATFTTYPQLRKIEATADSRNIASQRVMQKLGMLSEGLIREHRLLHGEVADEAWYGITRYEWEAARAAHP